MDRTVEVDAGPGDTALIPLQFWPDGPDRCVIEAWTMAPDWGSADAGPDMWTENDGAIPSLVLREDIAISEAIQQSMAEGFVSPIRLGYQEARIYHWHQSADDIIGRELIPENLRVPAVLNESWWHPNEPRLSEPTEPKTSGRNPL